MEGDQLRAEQVVSRGDALGDGDVDLALVIDETGYAPCAAGVEAVFVDLEPCFFMKLEFVKQRERRQAFLTFKASDCGGEGVIHLCEVDHDGP